MKADHAAPPNGAVSVNTFADRLGLSVGKIQHYCRIGRILGARQHPLTKRWWIYPPAKLLYP
jgi:hypothetical protein